MTENPTFVEQSTEVKHREQSFILRDKSEAVAIDRKMTIAYRTPESENPHHVDYLLITRDSELYISFLEDREPKHPPKVLLSEDKYVTLPVYLWPDRKAIIVGDQYRITIKGRSERNEISQIELRLRSTKPIMIEEIPRNSDFVRFLKRAEKAQAASVPPKEPRRDNLKIIL